MSRFLLECGQTEPVKLPYTYMRRAQASVHALKWRHIAVCDDKEALIKFFCNKIQEGLYPEKARITDLRHDQSESDIVWQYVRRES
jgi:hypothetical protein